MNILFVCQGNIIRSPLAENLFRQYAADHARVDGYHVDSAGTSAWHAGESPDPRMRRTAATFGVSYDGRARQVQVSDLDRFDLIIAMDRSNYADLVSMTQNGEQRDKIKLMREFDPDATASMDVPDPYYGGSDGFETTFRIVERSVRGLLEALLE
jgi:protein-tyrosine phosphatase